MRKRTKLISVGTKALAAVLATLLVTPACTGNLLPDPQIAAAALPREADVAVGTTHDVLLAACQDEVTLLDLFMPVAVTAIFVGMGRLDAAFYLPGALLDAAVPSCKARPFEVTGAALSGSAFALEPTANPAAFKLHALAEGTTRFDADVSIARDTAHVTSTLRAWNVDRVAFAPACSGAGGAAVPLVPAGKTMAFAHRLYHGTMELSGYGLSPVTHERLSILQVGRSTAVVQVAAIRGQFTLTSPLDPTYSQDLFAYEATDTDSLAVSRVTGEDFLVGETTSIVPRTTVAGVKPCVWGFARQVTVETPAVCEFDGRPGVPTLTNLDDSQMRLAALSPGVCRVRVEFPESALAAAIEIPVRPNYEQVPIDEFLGGFDGLEGMWAAGPDDLFLVGYKGSAVGTLDGLILRRSGGAWKPTVRLSNSGTLRAIHGVGPSGPIWTVGNDGLAARFDGTRWTVLRTGVAQDLYGVWVTAADDVWAVGDAGTVVHWDGTAWTVIPTGITARLTGIWGPPGGDPIVVGGNRTVLRLTVAGPQPVLPTDLDVPLFDSPKAIDGVSADDLWIVDREAALHFDGAAWSVPDFGLTFGDALYDAWPAGDGFTYVLLHRAEGTFLARHGPSGVGYLPLPLGDSIDGAGTTVWILSYRSLYRYAHDPLAVFP